jgi:toxin ParE1/3/4
MTSKPVVVSPQAQREIRQAAAYYRSEGGDVLALKWTAGIEHALKHVSRHAMSGSTRYAMLLKLAGLRFWPVRGFPHLIFYVERESQIDVWRVLYASRDIPIWMSEK